MKLALIVPGGVDRSGERRVVPFLLWLIERLARRHEVHVFALRQESVPGRWPLLGAQVHNAGARPRRVRALAALLAEHRRSPFDVIHAFWAIPQGVVGIIARRLIRRPLVLSLAGGELVSLPSIDYGGMRNARGRAWIRLALAGSDRVVSPCRSMVDEVNRLGWSAEVVPLGVALDEWPPRPPGPRVAGEPARLLHVADLSPVKDQETLLAAVALLKKGGVAFTLDVVGGDSSGGLIERRAVELGLQGHVRFHGFLPQPRLRNLAKHGDLLIVSSRHEAGPVVVLEAAALGIPTVGTAVGYVREWAPAAAAAVPVGDARALASEIRRYLGDEDARMALARAAHARALSQNADEMTAAYERVYEALRTGRERPRIPAPGAPVTLEGCG